MAIYNIGGKEIDFVGIGKIMIDTDSESYNVPHLHFLVYRSCEHFEAVCLELGLISSGPTAEVAAECLVDHADAHIKFVITEGMGFAELQTAVQDEYFTPYWGVYRSIEFWLAQTKHDLSHKLDSIITRAAVEMLEANFKNFIKAKAEELADDIIEIVGEFKKMAAVKNYSYVSLEVAA